MTNTTYKTNSGEREALMLDWDEVREILGHEHTGSPADDDQIITHIVADGFYHWIEGAEGAVEEEGYYLIRPNISD